MKQLALPLLLLIVGCSPPSDEHLKQQAARACGVSPKQITLWEVERDPATGKAIAIASSGVGRCLEDWKTKNGIMSKFS